LAVRLNEKSVGRSNFGRISCCKISEDISRIGNGEKSVVEVEEEEEVVEDEEGERDMSPYL